MTASGSVAALGLLICLGLDLLAWGRRSPYAAFFDIQWHSSDPLLAGQLLLPFLGSLVGVEVSTATVSHTEFMVFGALIVWFLIVEPHGLAKLWSIAKQKLRLWPFPH